MRRECSTAKVSTRSSMAFTLIELIVVIVLLSVVAAVFAPRLAGNEERRAEQSAREVRNLVSIAAHRDSLGSERMSVAYHADAGVLAIETRRAAPDGSHGWRPDALAASVRLSPLKMRSVAIDGQALDGAEFRVEFPDHEPRGVVEFVLERPGTADVWHIVLLPGAVQAQMNKGAMPANLLRPIDLDAQGSGASPW